MKGINVYVMGKLLDYQICPLGINKGLFYLILILQGSFECQTAFGV